MFRISLVMRPGHVANLPVFTALIKVDFNEPKHVGCKNIASSAYVFCM